MNELIILMIFIHVGVTFGPIDEIVFRRAFDGTLRDAPAGVEVGNEHQD